MCLDRKTVKEILKRVRPRIGYKYFIRNKDLYNCMFMNDLVGGRWYFCYNPTERIGSTMAGFHFFRSIASALKARCMFDDGDVLCKIEYLHPVAFGSQYGAAAGVAHAIRIIKEIN